MGKKASKRDEKFIKNYDENDDIGHFLNVDIEYLEELHDLHIDLRFLPEKIEINGRNNLVCTRNDKRNYVVDIRNIRALEHGLKLKKSL